MSTVAEVIAEMREAVTFSRTHAPGAAAGWVRVAEWAAALEAATAGPAPLHTLEGGPLALKGGGPLMWVTVRDYFAGQALAGVLANAKLIVPSEPHTSTSWVAAVAYRYADALLAARAQPKGEAQP